MTIQQPVFLGQLLGYIVAAKFAMQCLRGVLREVVFALVNLAGLYFFFFRDSDPDYLLAFQGYIALVCLQYAMLWLFVSKRVTTPWIAFYTPILALVVMRYILPFSGAPAGFLSWTAYMVGISYLAFRTSHLVIEVRNGSVKPPGFWNYLGFCFFVPTMSVGPINTYSNYSRAFDPVPPSFPPGRAALRILVGIVKFKFLGAICYQLTYSGLLMDDHYHPWIDLPVAILFYYLYLYVNFSGFCDMAIGTAGLIGIPVPENFNSPFAARNVKDFWNRWHITLSQYMRDVVFSPLSKYLVRLTGVAYADHAIALTIVIVFLLVGIWHGAGWNFAAYGAAHALGVVTNHYYTIALKKRLGRDGFKAYNANPWIHAVAVMLTFCYCATSLILFANTFPEIGHILAILK